MRNLQVSGWMSQPELTIIEAKGGDKGLPYQFTLVTTIGNPSTKTQEDGSTAATAATPVAAATPAPPGTSTPAAAASSSSDECDLDSTATTGGAP